MSEEHAYRVAAWWTSGRTGLAKSDSAPNAIHFTAPTEFGGLEGRWTPEELLLAAIAAFGIINYSRPRRLWHERRIERDLQRDRTNIP